MKTNELRLPLKDRNMNDVYAQMYPGRKMKSVTFIVTHGCDLQCYVKGSKVTMADLTKKNIEDVQVGDEVLGFDEYTTAYHHTRCLPSTVTRTYKSYADELLEFTMETGERFTVTPKHPLLTDRGSGDEGRFRYREAKNFTVGQCLKRLPFLMPENTADTDSYEHLKFLCVVKPAIVRKKAPFVRTKIIGIKSVKAPQFVYNLETSTHTYIAEDILTHNCTYCYEVYKDRNKSMSLETAKKCVDLLFEEDAKHSSYINEENTHGIILDFIGGEPLLEIKLIDQIVDYFLLKAVELDHRWATQFMISMTSNGVHYFDKDVIDFLKKHEHRVSIAITIDGNKELHDSCRVFPDGRGSYDLAAAAFKDAKERFNYHGTKMTLAKANIKYLYKACRDMIETFDLTELWANCVYEDEWDAKDASLFYAELKKMADWFVDSGRYEKTYFELFNGDVGVPLLPEDNQNWCGGTGDMLAFDIDGTCYPCMRYAPLSMPKEMSKQFVIGHCDTGLEATECQHNCVECLKKITRRSQSTDKCWNCPIGRGCAWCSAWNAECNGGNPDKRCTNICIMHQARCLAARYYYGKLAKKLGIENHFALNVPEEWALEIIDKKEYEMLKEMK